MDVDCDRKAEDGDGDCITRNPSQCEAVPEWSEGKRAECTLRHVSPMRIDEGECSHRGGDNDRADIDIVTVRV